MAGGVFIRPYAAFTVAGMTLRSRTATSLFPLWKIKNRSEEGHHVTSYASPGVKVRCFSNTTTPSDLGKKRSNRERMKVLVRDYGATAVVFHTTISLTSLGLCYLLVS